MSQSFLVFFKYFGDKYGVRGSRFGDLFGRSKNIPKSIAIDEESLISHLGIIKNPNKPYIYITKKTRQTQHRIIFCWPYMAL